MGAITSITGLQNLPNLQDFRADFNYLTTVDLSGLENLTYVDISDCDIPDTNDPSLTSVNLTGCTALEELRLDDSNFSAGIPDLTGLTSLTFIDVDQCNITGEVDFSGLPALDYLDISGNTGLTSIIISYTQPFIDLYAGNCALTQTAVDNILDTLANNGISGGIVDLGGGTNSHPGPTGLAAKTTLEDNGWSVTVNQAPGGSAQIAPSTDFDIVGDFTIEMFLNLSNTDSPFPRPYSFGMYPAANAISIEGGSLYFWADNAVAMSGPFDPAVGEWSHVAVMGTGSGMYTFVDGVGVTSGMYSGTISSQGLPLTLGYGNEEGSYYNGLMSNFRWTNAAIYPTEGFTPPTSPLTALSQSILLTFQGTNTNALLLDNSGNGNNASGSNIVYNTSNPFAGVTGSIQMGRV